MPNFTPISIFNTLPRRQHLADNKTPNHWHFSVRHMALNPPATVLYIVNPYQPGLVELQGPLRGSPLTRGQTAQWVVDMLIRTFATSALFKEKRVGAPWTWGTDDPQLAQDAVQEMGRRHIRGELLVITAGQTAADTIAEESWKGFAASVEGQAAGTQQSQPQQLQICG